MKISKLIIALAVIVGISACVKDNFDFDKLSTSVAWNPKLAIPLGYGSVGLEKFLENQDTSGLIRTNSENVLIVLFEQDLFSYQLDSLNPGDVIGAIPIVDINEANSLYPAINTIWPLPATAQILADSVVFKTGVMRISLINNNMAYDGTFAVGWGDLTRNDSTFLGTLPFTGSSPATIDVPIKGYTLDLTNLTGSNFNVNITADLVFTSPGVLDPLRTAQVVIEFADYTFSTVYGIATDSLVSLPSDSIDFDIMGDVFNGDIYLADPKFELNVQSTFGIPVNVKFSEFFTYNQETGDKVNIVGSSPTDTVKFDIDYPKVVGESASTTIILDNSKTNLSEAIAISPNYMYYNVMGGVSDVPGTFVMDTSKIDINMIATIPIYGYASGFEIRDTIEMDFADLISAGQDYDQVESALIRIWLDNGFPIDVDVQLYFADVNYTILDSLVDSTTPLLSAAPVNPTTGVVTTITSTTTDLVMNTIRLKKVEPAKYLIFKGAIQTYDYGNTKPSVKIKSDYEIGFRVGAQSQFNIKFD